METERGGYGYGGICGHGLDDTHGKWGTVSRLYRVDVGGLWQIGGCMWVVCGKSVI